MRVTALESSKTMALEEATRTCLVIYLMPKRAKTLATTLRDTLIGEINLMVAMIAIDKDGNIGAGTSTNGASHKIPG